MKYIINLLWVFLRDAFSGKDFLLHWIISDSVFLHALSSSVLNPCKNVCSHLCLLRPSGYTCACPQGSSQVEFDSNKCDAGKQQQQQPHWMYSLQCRASCCAVSHFSFINPFSTCVWLLLYGFVKLWCDIVFCFSCFLLCMPGFCTCSYWGTCCNAPCMSMHEWWNLLHWWGRTAQVQVSVAAGAI